MWLTGAPPYGVVTPRWNPETVRAGLGGDTYHSSLPFCKSARMYFVLFGHDAHALSLPEHSRALLCIPSFLAFATMTATSTRPPRSRGTSGHTGTPLPRAPFVLPGRLLSPLGPRPKPLFVVNFPPLRPITRRRHPCRWVGLRRWAPLRRFPGVGCHRRSVIRTRRSSRTVDPQLSPESTGAFWSSLAAALLCCSEESRESPETFPSLSSRSPDISGAEERPSRSPAIEPFCRPG